jgi:hemolysin D
MADSEKTAQELAAAQLEVARLQTVAFGAPFTAPSGADPQAVKIAQREAQDEIAERDAKLRGLSADIDQHRQALEGAKAEADRLKSLLPLAQQRAKIFQDLADSGYGSSLQLVEAQEKQTDTAKSLEVQLRRIPELQAQVDSAVRARAQAEAEASKNALASLAEIQVKADSLAKELNKASERVKGRTLTAPVDGTVQELSVHTIGGVVEPGQILMRIAPANGPLEVEAALANQDIGFVRPGMAAEIKVETFPFTRYGLLHATVESVSRDALTESKPADTDTTQSSAGTSGPRYMLLLRLERNAMVIDGKIVSLEPGMMVTAEVMTGRRRIIDFVLSPLAKAAAEAGRER